MYVSWIQKVSPLSQTVCLTCCGTAWLKLHQWLNNLCPFCKRPESLKSWSSLRLWQPPAPVPLPTSRPLCHRGCQRQLCCMALCGQTHPGTGGRLALTPSSHDCESSCPRPALTHGGGCSKHKASPWCNSRFMGSGQPVDKASSILGGLLQGSHRSCLTEEVNPFAHRSNLNSLHLISFFSHSVSVYAFITSAPLDHLTVRLPAPRSLSQTF